MVANFPGIDPYVEDQGDWHDFHSRTITYFSDSVADGLPDRYLIQIEERIRLLERPTERGRRIRPDRMVERTRGAPASGGLAVTDEADPVTIPLPVFEAVRESYIENLRRSDQTILTVIELLSPDNTSGIGFYQHCGKRNTILGGQVHLVELDFLIGGHRLPVECPLPPGDA